MILALLTLLAALSVAGVAGWFSIVGVMSIYAGAPLHAALVMGVVLEVAKLVTTSWLYRNWDTSSWKIKGPLVYFTTALMIATSIGVFGFLTKAHLEQGAATVDNTAKVERLDQQILREKSSIADNEKVIGQLDTAINSYLGKDNADRALSVRRGQAPQRKLLRNDIDAAQKRIDEYSDEKFKLTSQVRALQLEVGPIRYIAELFYGNGGDEVTKIESAVKLFTLLIVSTLDPLAVILLIAANHTFLRRQNEKEIKKKADDEISLRQEIPKTTVPEEQIQGHPENNPVTQPPCNKPPQIQATVNEGDAEVVKEISVEEVIINEEKEIVIEANKEEETALSTDVITDRPLETRPVEIKIDDAEDSVAPATNTEIPEDKIVNAEEEIVAEPSEEETQVIYLARHPGRETEIYPIEAETGRDEELTPPTEQTEIPGDADEEMHIEPALPDVPVLTAPTAAIISPAITRVSRVIKEDVPTIVHAETSNQAPWAHQESVLRELIGSQPHFVSVPIDNDILHAPTPAIVDNSNLKDKIKVANTGKYPKALSWVEEFKGD